MGGGGGGSGASSFQDGLDDLLIMNWLLFYEYKHEIGIAKCIQKTIFAWHVDF